MDYDYIECVDYNIYKCKKPKYKRKKTLLIIFLCIAIVYSYNRFVVFELISKITSDSIKSFCNESANEAILSIYTDADYSDIVNISYADNEISFIRTNSTLINKITREIIANTSMILSDKIGDGIKIPMFAFTGLTIFAGYGKEVYFKTISINDMSCKFDSKFVSQGVNQTLHSIYVDIICIADIEFPLHKKAVEISTPVLLTENVLIGKVPSVYLNGNLFAK